MFKKLSRVFPLGALLVAVLGPLDARRPTAVTTYAPAVQQVTEVERGVVLGHRSVPRQRGWP